MLYLNKNIRYRVEDDLILVCDCKNLIDYELPICYQPLLEALQSGYDETKSVGVHNEKELLIDLCEMEIISDNKHHVAKLKSDIWKTLSYSENEFYI